MLLACRSPVGEYFQAVMEHGGDATLADTKTGEVPLDIVLDRYIPDSRQRVEVLLRHDVALDGNLQSLIDKLAARGETLAQAEMDLKERKAKRPPVRGRE